MAGDPNSPHWWMRPHTLESAKETYAMVKDAHGKGLSFASISMNRIEIAILELIERMEKDQAHDQSNPTSSGSSTG